MQDFVKERHGAMHIATAIRQQKQINYLIQSNIQEDVNQEYIKAWTSRKYATNDYFLNWVKTIFKTTNFLSVFKYLRSPLPSARIVNNEIKPQLKRVFYADDAYLKCIIRGKEADPTEELDSGCFAETVFDALLFRYNDVIVTDLDESGKPIRNIISIDDVIAIESRHNSIKRIAYAAKWNGERGYLYIDSEAYIFYNYKHEVLNTVPHDLGVCPADWISNEAFYSDNDIVRKSEFSYLRPDLEEYVFLKTLQRMSEPNGAIPVVSKLKVKENDLDGKSQAGLPSEPMAVGSAEAAAVNIVKAQFADQDAALQTGTIYSFNAPKDPATGKRDMDAVKNFINFHYIPTECLEFINKRVKEIKTDIINTVLGDYVEQNQSAKNELQIGKSYDNKQDKLRAWSRALSTVVTNTDRKALGLKYGIGNIYVDRFFGSDFFLETDAELFELISTAPNVLERKNLIVRQSQNKNRFNPDKAQRIKLLYELMPYAADVDFKTALEQKIVDAQTISLQTQFSYFISLFEAKYGDILQFYNNLDASNSERLIVIKNLLTGLIPKINLQVTE